MTIEIINFTSHAAIDRTLRSIEHINIVQLSLDKVLIFSTHKIPPCLISNEFSLDSTHIRMNVFSWTDELL